MGYSQKINEGIQKKSLLITVLNGRNFEYDFRRENLRILI